MATSRSSVISSGTSDPENQNEQKIINSQPVIEELFRAQAHEIILLKRDESGSYTGYCDVKFVADDGFVLVHGALLWLARQSFIDGVMKLILESVMSLREEVTTVILCGVKLRYLKIVLTLFYKGETYFQVEEEKDVRELMRILGIQGFSLTSSIITREEQQRVVAGIRVNSQNVIGEDGRVLTPVPPSSVTMYVPSDFEEKTESEVSSSNSREVEEVDVEEPEPMGTSIARNNERIQQWLEHPEWNPEGPEANNDDVPTSRQPSEHDSTTNLEGDLKSPAVPEVELPSQNGSIDENFSQPYSNLNSALSNEQQLHELNHEEEAPGDEALDVGGDGSNGEELIRRRATPRRRGKQQRKKFNWCHRKSRTPLWRRKSPNATDCMASSSPVEEVQLRESRSNSLGRRSGRPRRNGMQVNFLDAVEADQMRPNSLAKSRRTNNKANGRGRKSRRMISPQEIPNLIQSTPPHEEDDMRHSKTTNRNDAPETMMVESPNINNATSSNLNSEVTSASKNNGKVRKRRRYIKPKTTKRNKRTSKARKHLPVIPAHVETVNQDGNPVGSETSAVAGEQSNPIGGGEESNEGDHQFPIEERSQVPDESGGESWSPNEVDSEINDRTYNPYSRNRSKAPMRGYRRRASYPNRRNKVVEEQALPLPVRWEDERDEEGDVPVQGASVDEDAEGESGCGGGDGRETGAQENLDVSGESSTPTATEKGEADFTVGHRQMKGSLTGRSRSNLNSLGEHAGLKSVTVNLERLTLEQIASIKQTMKQGKKVTMSRHQGVGAYVFQRDQTLPIAGNGGRIEQRSSLELNETRSVPEDEEIEDPAIEQNFEAPSELNSLQMTSMEGEVAGRREGSGKEFKLASKKRKLSENAIIPDDEDEEEGELGFGDSEKRGYIEPMSCPIEGSDASSKSSFVMAEERDTGGWRKFSREEPNTKKRKLQEGTVTEEEDGSEGEVEAVGVNNAGKKLGSLQTPVDPRCKVISSEGDEDEAGRQADVMSNIEHEPLISLNKNEERRIEASSDDSFSDGEMEVEGEPVASDMSNRQPTSLIVQSPCQNASQQEQDDELENGSDEAPSSLEVQESINPEATQGALMNLSDAKVPSNKRASKTPPLPSTSETRTTPLSAYMLHMKAKPPRSSKLLTRHVRNRFRGRSVAPKAPPRNLPQWVDSRETEPWSVTTLTDANKIVLSRKTTSKSPSAPRTGSQSVPPNISMLVASSSSIQSATLPSAEPETLNQRKASPKQTLSGSGTGPSLPSVTVSQGPYADVLRSYQSDEPIIPKQSASPLMQTSSSLEALEDICSGYSLHHLPTRSLNTASISLPPPSLRGHLRGPSVPWVQSLNQAPMPPSNLSSLPIVQNQFRMAPSNRTNKGRNNGDLQTGRCMMQASTSSEGQALQSEMVPLEQRRQAPYNQSNREAHSSQRTASSTSHYMTMAAKFNSIRHRLRRIEQKYPGMNQPSQSNQMGQHKMQIPPVMQHSSRQLSRQQDYQISHQPLLPPQNVRGSPSTSSPPTGAPQTMSSRSHFTCNECGHLFLTEETLRMHLLLNLCRKTT